jgi:flagellin FlaB
MVKNMKNEMKNENRDDLGAIGIGAMIVFIALILVAAVASAVIIQTAEKLQQNAQEAGEGTKDAISSKVMIINAVRGGGNDVTLTVELAPGSDDVTAANVQWVGVCAAGTDQDTFGGNLENLDGAAAAATMLADEVYEATIDLGTCSGQETTLYIQSGAAGMTYEILNLPAAAGELVI